MIVAKYTSNVSGYVPTFNAGYVYSVNEQLSNGVYVVEIESDTDFSSVMFGTAGDNDVTSLLSVEYLKITNKVSDLLSCFRRCTNVTSINTDGWDTSNITDLQTTFGYCSALTTLDTSGWNTSNVTNLRSTFYGCSALTTLDVSGWDTSNVTTLYATFRDCSSLTTLDVSKWDTSKVTEMTNIFTNCSVKSIGVLYCSDDTITKLANTITAQCDFYLDRINISSPNPLVNFIEYKECKKEVVYYDTNDNSWKKPILREWDSIEKHSDGKYYYHKRSGEVVLDENIDSLENVQYRLNSNFTNVLGHVNVTTFSVVISDYLISVSKGTIISDRFKTDIDRSYDGAGIYNTDTYCGITTIGVKIDNNELSSYDANGFKKYLETKPIVLVYKLEQEKVYECTNLDLITYANETNLLVESGALNPKASLKVSKGVGNTITILQNKFNVLENDINNDINDINNDINDINNEIDVINTDLVGVPESVEGSFISVDSKDGYLKDIEIIGNTIQNQNDLADIRSVGDKLENQELYEIPVLSCGKNLLGHIDHSISGGDRLYFEVNLNKNTDYIISANHGSVFEYRIMLCEKQLDSQNRPVEIKQLNIGDRRTFNTESNFGEFYIFCHFSNAYEKYQNESMNIQLEEGTVATPYEPYQEDKLTILSPTPLEKVGDVADRIICKDGVWGVEKNVGNKILDGGETEWAYNGERGTATSFILPFNSGYIYTDVLISNRFPYNNEGALNDAESIRFTSSGKIAVQIYKNRLSSDDILGLTKYLKDNNLLIKYILNQSQFIPLPHDQQIALRTFANKTNIHFECEIEPTLKASIPKSIGANVNSHTEQIGNLSKELEKINNLEESVVSTVTSENNFTTVENTSNGYFEGVKLEGNTLVNRTNIFDKVNPTGAGVYQKTNNSIIVDYSKCGQLSNARSLDENDIFKGGQIYTIVIDILQNTLNLQAEFYPMIWDFATIIYGTHYIDVGEIGRKVLVLQVNKNYPLKLAYAAPGQATNGLTGLVEFKDIMVLDGKYANKELPSYFKGLKSVGQDVDEISVLSSTFEEYKLEQGAIDTQGNIRIEDSSLSTDFISVHQNVIYKITDNLGLGYDRIAFYDKNKNFLYRTDTHYGSKVSEVKAIPDSCFMKVAIYKGGLPIHVEDLPYIEVSTKQDKKRILYYNNETQTWEKPILRQWDSIEKHSDGKYYYHKRSGEVVLNGGESGWKLISNSNNTTRFNIPIIDCTVNNQAGVICDKFNYVAYVDSESVWLGNNSPSSLNLAINNSKLSTKDVAGFKAWLQANNVTVVYQLAKEKVYECTDLDLITYADETNLLVDSGAINPKVNLKVSKGVGNTVTMLQNKVAMLEQMLFNLMNMFNNQQSNIDE